MDVTDETNLALGIAEESPQRERSGKRGLGTNSPTGGNAPHIFLLLGKKNTSGKKIHPFKIFLIPKKTFQARLNIQLWYQRKVDIGVIHQRTSP